METLFSSLRPDIIALIVVQKFRLSHSHLYLTNPTTTSNFYLTGVQSCSIGMKSYSNTITFAFCDAVCFVVMFGSNQRSEFFEIMICENIETV
eukprot:m.43591 g.43591  ORF g.43591 m.43591 type:complete len:93 (-) comp9985_c0_seq1:99-377(-)